MRIQKWNPLSLINKSLPLDSTKAVLFDKDGTLCCSEKYLEALANARASFCVGISAKPELLPQLLAAYGLSKNGIHPAGASAVASRHSNLISTATVLAMNGVDWCDAQEWAEIAFSRADSALADRKAQLTPTLPGLVAMLQRLQQKGITLAVLSSDLGPSLETFLQHYQLSQFFRAVYGAERNPAKPSPAAALTLCNELGFEPQHCGMVGDAQADLNMAAAAGLGWNLAYNGGWKQPLQLSGSHGYLEHWDQLAPL